MDGPPPGLPRGGSRISAGTAALAGLFDLTGVVLAAVARLNLTTILKTVQFGFSYWEKACSIRIELYHLFEGHRTILR
jgi:hypothetical protein